MLIDTATYILMQSIENPVITTITSTISLIFDPITFTIIALAISAYLFFKSRKKQSLFLASAILITAAIIKLSKEIIQRARPPTALIQETSYAFPSGHTTMAVVFLGLITYMFTKNKSTKTKTTATLIIIFIVLAIIFSRIYLKVHWLTDTIAGFVLGLIILIISIKIYNKIITSS